MTRDEARQVFTRMMTVWPHASLPDETVSYWIGWLQRQPANHAAETVDALALELKYFPTVSEYQTVARRVVSQAQIRAPRALASPRSSKETAAYWIEQCRSTLHSKRNPAVRIYESKETP